MSKVQDYANQVFGEEYPDITTEEAMAIQEFKETGGEKWDFEDTPRYWQQRDAEDIIWEEGFEEYLDNQMIGER